MCSSASLASGALGAALIFLVYLLFIDGGVFTVYLEDRKLSRAEFFENAGLFFWRMVRLALYSVVPFGLLMAANGGIASSRGNSATMLPPERLGFFVNLGRQTADCGGGAVRAPVVRPGAGARGARQRTQILRTLWRSLKLAFRSGKLYASYLGIGLIAAATFALGD